MPEPLIYDLEFSRWARTTLTLSADRLACHRRGFDMDVPLTAVRHFFIDPMPRFVVEVSHSVFDGEFVVAYDDGAGGTRVERFPLALASPSFRSWLAALARRRPDASLLDLPPAQALRQLGLRSTFKKAMVYAAVLIAIIALVVGVGAALLAQRGR
jgi:hypothetical protein